MRARSPRSADSADLRLRWNAVWIALFADVQLIQDWAATVSFAQPDGSPELTPALREWAATPAARRAVLHCQAVQTFYETIPRGREPALHVSPSVHSSLLVLHTWRRLAPPEHLDGPDERARIGIDHSDGIDWQLLGQIGVPGAEARAAVDLAGRPPAEAAFIVGDALGTFEGCALSARRLPAFDKIKTDFGRGLSMRMATALKNLAETEPASVPV